jgi:UDP-N-acetylmuramate dehydrogenase
MKFLARCRAGVSLARYSTFGIGGKASLLFEAKTKEDIVEAFLWVKKENLPWLIVGKGSNCLFADEGFSGLVILNKIDFLQQEETAWRVGSGYSFASLGKKTASLGFSGLEYAAGIPGSVGGAIYMNAGASGQSLSSVVHTVTFVDEEGSISILPRDSISFAYRTSSFQCKKGAIVEAVFLLPYEEGALARQQAFMEKRKATQPYQEKSCGCVFRNPPGMSAGMLIEKAGLKGLRVGGAEVSTVHANFIINKGSATARDVMDLAKQVQEEVYAKEHVVLERELCLMSDGKRAV